MALPIHSNVLRRFSFTGRSQTIHGGVSYGQYFLADPLSVVSLPRSCSWSRRFQSYLFGNAFITLREGIFEDLTVLHYL